VFDGARRSVCPFSSLPLIFTITITEEHNKSSTAPVPARTKKKYKEEKPLTLPEHRLAAALDDVASTRSSSPVNPLPPPAPTHVAEQAALRAETIAAFHSGAAVGRRRADSGDAEQEEEGGLFTLREKTKDEIEQEEAEYRAYLEREVGPLEKILDLGDEERVDAIRRVEDEDAHTRPDETDSGKKKRKKKAKKGAEDRKETDQEFLIK
jgi:protein KRI1